jgi:hypothetical protein
MNVTEPSFTTPDLLHGGFFCTKDTYAEIYKNPPNPLATESRSQEAEE